jgi:hypothetical protein
VGDRSLSVLDGCAGRLRERGIERGAVGVADAVYHVPVGAARRQRQWTSRRDPGQPALRVDQVQQRKEVVLARAAAVEEDERTIRLARRRAHAMGQLVHAASLA